MNKVALIMAGGSGERFWPISRSALPKQFLKLFTDISLVRGCFLRVNSFIKRSNIFIVCSNKHKDKIIKEIPECNTQNFIIEPLAKDTAAAIALSVIYIKHRLANSTILVCASDHVIEKDEAFRQNIEDAFDIAEEKKCIITIGIAPTRPETNYGYIETTLSAPNSINGKISHFYDVESFREKPSYDNAKAFLKAGNFFWNSGMFVFTIDTILKEIELYMPKLFSKLSKLQNAIDNEDEDRIKEEIFHKLQKISIDFGLMEKTSNIICIKSDFIWDDVGSWSSYFRFFKGNKHRNIEKGKVITHDTENSLIIGNDEGLIAVAGLSNTIVIKTKDVLLVCKKDADIKELLKEVKANKDLKPFL